MRRPLDRHLSKMVVAIACLAMAAQTAVAQARGAAGGAFGTGYTDVGPVVGFGNLGVANISFGGRFEHAIMPLPDLANGMLGIEVGLDYASGSNPCGGFGGCTFTARQLNFGATANYHFKLDEPKFDPFVGLGLGYQSYSCSYSISTTFGCGYSSGILLIGRAGARYFFSPQTAVYGDIGAGAATLNIGFMFKMK